VALLLAVDRKSLFPVPVSESSLSEEVEEGLALVESLEPTLPLGFGFGFGDFDLSFLPPLQALSVSLAFSESVVVESIKCGLSSL